MTESDHNTNNSAATVDLKSAPPAESPEAARQFMLDQVTRHSNAIVIALINKASDGHYQAARFLLEELSKMSVEKSGDGCRSIAEILLPVAERLFVKRRKQQSSADESDSDDLGDSNHMPEAPFKIQ
jgi:hypothetical protein